MWETSKSFIWSHVQTSSVVLDSICESRARTDAVDPAIHLQLLSVSSCTDRYWYKGQLSASCGALVSHIISLTRLCYVVDDTPLEVCKFWGSLCLKFVSSAAPTS